MTELQPTSILKIVQIMSGFIEDWMASRIFVKNGKEICVRGFGRTRRDALVDFDAEVELEEMEQ